MNPSDVPSIGGRKPQPGLHAILMVAAAVCCLAAWPFVAGCADPTAHARSLEEQGDATGAVRAYQQVLQSDADNHEALVGAAVCLLMLGRYEEAVVLQERIIALDPKDVQTRIELGFNYLNHQGRSEDAVLVLREAAALQPSGKTLSFLAQAEMAVDDNELAEESLRRAMSVEPEYAYSYQLLFRLLEREGRGREAQEVLEKAASLGIDVSHSS